MSRKIKVLEARDVTFFCLAGHGSLEHFEKCYDT